MKKILLIVSLLLTVITGIFKKYPNRNELGLRLKDFGADIDTSITNKTKILVFGDNPGEAKLKKIEELRRLGQNCG